MILMAHWVSWLACVPRIIGICQMLLLKFMRWVSMGSQLLVFKTSDRTVCDSWYGTVVLLMQTASTIIRCLTIIGSAVKLYIVLFSVLVMHWYWMPVQILAHMIFLLFSRESMILLSFLSSVLRSTSWIRVFYFWPLVTQAIKWGIWDNITR